MYTIRKYKTEDYLLLKSWWDFYEEPYPFKSMIPLESTYVVELQDRAVMSASLIFTNVSEYCYVENFIRNPILDSALSKEMSHSLLAWLEKVAKEKNYKRLICLSYHEPLVKKYQDLGFVSTLTGVTTFMKELS